VRVTGWRTESGPRSAGSRLGGWSASSRSSWATSSRRSPTSGRSRGQSRH